MDRFRSLLATSVLALAACTTGPVAGGGPRHDDGDRFRMAPGTSVSIAGEGRLAYVALVNDSRCKPDVQCVWAGDAEVAFEWRPSAGATDAFSLHTGKGDKSHRIGAHLLTLVSLDRGDAPVAELMLEAAP